LDIELNELFKGLDELNLSKKTIVIMTADHGEGLLDHEYVGHGATLYEELIHVPLIIRIPNLKPQIIYNQVRSIDIFPTILDILGISIPSNIQGKSLIPIIQGKVNEDMIVYSVIGPSISIRSDNFKLIYDIAIKKEELYSLINDPKEKINLAGKGLEIQNKLENNLLEQIELIKKQSSILYPNLKEHNYYYNSVPVININENKLNIISSNPGLIFETNQTENYCFNFSEFIQNSSNLWYSNGCYLKLQSSDSNHSDVVLIHPKHIEIPSFLAQNIFLQTNKNYVLVAEVADIANYFKKLSPCEEDVIIEIKILDNEVDKERMIYKNVTDVNDGWKTIYLDISEYAGKNITFKIEGWAGGPGGMWCGEYAAINKFYIGETTEKIQINETEKEKIRERLKELGYIT